MKKIAILFGGTSSEYEVSLKSAASVLDTLTMCEVEIYKIGIDLSNKWYLTSSSSKDIAEDNWLSDMELQALVPLFDGQGFYNKKQKEYFKPDVIFPILHGSPGEDGTIQGLLELMKISYVGCGVATSAICMNKYLLHLFAENAGVKSAPTLLVSSKDDDKSIKAFIAKHGLPVFIKPNEAGSSKGISKVNAFEELESALKEAFQFSKKIIIQKAVSGTEIGCAILGNEELIVGECDEVSLNSDFFDYAEKYQMITAKINVPAAIPQSMSHKIKQQAKLLYQLLGCTGLARIDFFLTENNEILLNEINTLPGFTEHSRFPAMMEAVGISYQELILHLIKLAEEHKHGK